MTRYRAVQVAAVLLGGVAVARGELLWAVVVGAAVGVVVALGVFLPQLRFFGPYVCRGLREGAEPVVALTFDDGPDPRSTPALLDLLREARVEAAFFCIGARAAAHPDLTARIAREGHLVENHSYHHSHLTNFFSERRLRTELERTQVALERLVGVAPTCFRPPMGLSNPRVFRAARAAGLKVVGWTARGFDTRVVEPERIVKRIVRAVEPGAILLLHDGNIPAERLVLTVRGLLAELQANGYRVVRLDRVLAPAGATDSPAAATPRVGAALPSAVGGAQFGGQARGAP
jgi:peptidoglycan/xylan/chitin deacetylase (PgdA/CDA1 family)